MILRLERIHETGNSKVDDASYEATILSPGIFCLFSRPKVTKAEAVFVGFGQSKDKDECGDEDWDMDVPLKTAVAVSDAIPAERILTPIKKTKDVQ